MGVESRNGGREIGRENTRGEESRSERGRLRDSKFSDRQDLRDRYTFSLPNKLVPPPLLFSNYGVRSIIALFSTSLFFWAKHASLYACVIRLPACGTALIGIGIGRWISMTVTGVHAPHKLDGSVHCPTNQIFGSELKVLDCGLEQFHSDYM